MGQQLPKTPGDSLNAAQNIDVIMVLIYIFVLVPVLIHLIASTPALLAVWVLGWVSVQHFEISADVRRAI